MAPTALGFATWEEGEEWARRWKRERARSAIWYWPVKEGVYPLDELLLPANVRILRVLWRSHPPIHWPATIARETHLARSTVYRVLALFSEWEIVEKVPAWNSDRSFCYRMLRPHPLVKMLDRLFTAEAKLYFQNAAAPRRSVAGS